MRTNASAAPISLMSRHLQNAYGTSTSRIGGTATSRASTIASWMIASCTWWPAETSVSPEYLCSVSAMSSRNWVNSGIPPGTAPRNEFIHALNVLPVFVIPSAITSRPSTVW